MDNNFIKKFLRGSAFSSIGTLITIIFHFLSVKVQATLPKAEFGIFVYIIVISHGFQILGGLGLNLTLVKHLSEKLENIDKKIVTAIFGSRLVQLVVISLIVFFAGGYFLPWLTDEGVRPYLIYIPFIFGIASIRDLLFHLLQGTQRFKHYAVINILSAVTKLIALVLFWYAGNLTLQNMIWVEIITFGLSTLVLLGYAPIFQLLTWQLDREALRTIFSFGLPLYANDVLTYVYNRINVFLIGGFLTTASVALYDMASKIPDGFGRLFSSIIVVYFPNVSELINSGRKEEARRFMNKGLVLGSTALSMVCLMVFLFQREMILVVASEQYLDASMGLALLMINFSLSSIGRMMGYSIVAAGHSNVPVKINMVSSIVNIVGCVLLIPRVGYLGAIYALILMSIVAQALNYLFLVKADLKPEVVGYLKSIVIMLVLIAGYQLWGNDAYWVRGVFLVVYAAIGWFVIPEIKPAVFMGLGYLGLNKGATPKSA